MTARPPDPDYYRRFVAGWCGGGDAPIIVEAGKRAPRRQFSVAAKRGVVVVVGADWLKKQAIPREALEP